MLKFGKSVQEVEDNHEVFVIKKEPISVEVDNANPDRKPNSPCSKHSATEQCRRSKINDRFSMLRGIIPHGDQRRDKASFLLEEFPPTSNPDPTEYGNGVQTEDENGHPGKPRAALSNGNAVNPTNRRASADVKTNETGSI